MELNLNHIVSEKEAFLKTGISLPSYEIKKVRENTAAAPQWIHFGIGNIFRVFIAGIADSLLEQNCMDSGLICAEVYDREIVDRIYEPYDNLSLTVFLNPDGTREMRVIGSMAEAIQAQPDAVQDWNRLKAAFRSPALQMISFTITEKGYQLLNEKNELFPFVKRDLERGPDHCTGAMAVVSSMLWERYMAGKTPVALISMDNCAQNGKMLRDSILYICRSWTDQGFLNEDFFQWVSDENQVAFDSTMIDKITPRPSQIIADELEEAGLEAMHPILTEKRTYIAPFVNAEVPQYLVIEDRFPNGRPPLNNAAGVFLTDFDTVCQAERMKVTACLNPAHTAVGPLGVVLGYEEFADMLMKQPLTLQMAEQVVYKEGIPVAPDPGIISPKDFSDEVFRRFTNRYLGDTNLRLATDASQGVGVRFGETIRVWKEKYGSTESLTAIPLGIAGFFRYMMGIDDHGNLYELAPDPLAREISSALSSVRIGFPETYTGQLRPFLSNEKLFHINLYQYGIGMKVEDMFQQMVTEYGAVLKTLKKYIKAQAD